MVPKRVVVMKNMSPAIVDLLVFRELSPDGEYESRIRLDPHGGAEPPASTFNRRWRRGATIKVLVNGVPVRNPFVSETFYRYVKIYLDVHTHKSSLTGVEEHKLVVTGVRPKYTDLSRLWGFGFLGREYAGRPKELIV